MSLKLLSEKYKAEVNGVLHCYDRILISGHLQPLAYAKGMTKYLYEQGIRIFDYPQFAQPLRNMIRANAEQIAKENGLEIEFISQPGQFRKEERVHGLIKRVSKRYKYYLTNFGRQVSTMALKLREMVIIPSLAQQP